MLYPTELQPHNKLIITTEGKGSKIETLFPHKESGQPRFFSLIIINNSFSVPVLQGLFSISIKKEEIPWQL